MTTWQAAFKEKCHRQRGLQGRPVAARNWRLLGEGAPAAAGGRPGRLGKALGRREGAREVRGFAVPARRAGSSGAGLERGHPAGDTGEMLQLGTGREEVGEGLLR